MNTAVTATSLFSPCVSIALNDRHSPGVSQLRQLVQNGASLRKTIAALEQELCEIDRAIIEVSCGYIGHAEMLHVETDGVECAVMYDREVTVSNVMALREILGDSFHELVKAGPELPTPRLVPDPRLIAMAADADNPRAQEIAACLDLREAEPTVTYFCSTSS